MPGVRYRSKAEISQRPQLRNLLVIVLLTIIAYQFESVINSQYVGATPSDRTSAYLLMGLSMLEMILLFVLTTRRFRIPIVATVLALMAGWILIADLIAWASAWDAIKSIGLSIWWLLTYLFFQQYVSLQSSAVLDLRRFAVATYLLSIGATVYASYIVSSNYNVDFATVNVVYFALGIAPLILLTARRRVELFVFVTLIAISVFSFKRGAVVATVAMLIAYLFVESIVSKRKTSTALLTVSAPLVVLPTLWIGNYLSGGFLAGRFELTELSSGSGRSDIFANAMAEIGQRGAGTLFAGTGSGSSTELLGTAAHNEWFEFALRYGLIGVVLYAVLVTALVWQVRKLLLARSNYAPAAAAGATFVVVVGIYSSVYFAHSTMFVIMFFGVLYGLQTKGQQGQRSGPRVAGHRHDSGKAPA